MNTQFSRTELIYGDLTPLKEARVIVFGIGGVGGHCIEALVRAGIGSIDIVDHDIVSESNLNRQLIATHSTIGRDKVEVMKERLLDINPEVNIHTYKCFYLPETKAIFDLSQYDYIVDAIDTVTAKLQLIEEANKTHTPIISCMGTGNKIEPTLLEIDDIYNTSVCPLARVMRRELRKRGIKHLNVVYSKEEPHHNVIQEDHRRAIPGSTPFVPACAGIIMASKVINDILKAAD